MLESKRKTQNSSKSEANVQIKSQSTLESEVKKVVESISNSNDVTESILKLATFNADAFTKFMQGQQEIVKALEKLQKKSN